MKRNAGSYRRDLTGGRVTARRARKRLAAAGRLPLPAPSLRTQLAPTRPRQSMLTDLQYAVRWLRRSPGFARVAILSLGLGIGVNTAMFSLVDAVLLRPLPVRTPTRSSIVFTSSSDGDEYATNSYPGLSRPEGAEHGVQRHDRLHADVRAAQSRRSCAPGVRPGRDVESLRHARRAALPRADAAGRATMSRAPSASS